VDVVEAPVADVHERGDRAGRENLNTA
jgi:hypothetical protein